MREAMRVSELLALAAMGGQALSRMHFQHLLAKMVMLITLATITGVLISMLAAGLLYAIYLLLVQHGLEAEMAYVTVGIVLTALVLTCVALLLRCLASLRNSLQPITALSNLAHAFIDGFLSTK